MFSDGMFSDGMFSDGRFSDMGRLVVGFFMYVVCNLKIF